jgi:hypothetical protein
MSAADRKDSKRGALAWWAGVAAATCVGIYVRLRDVGTLHLILDERLVLRSLQQGSLWDAFVRHTVANNSPPLTIYARWLFGWDALDELTLRLPMIASGILLLLLPLLFARRLGRPTALLYLALLAGCAPLVYFSALARPYAPALLAIGVAFFAWDEAAHTGRRSARAGFGIAASAAVFLHAFAAPVVAAPFAVSLGEVLRGRLSWRAWAEEVAWAGATAVLLLGPGAVSFIAVHSAKVATAKPSPELAAAILERIGGGDAGAAIVTAAALGMGLAVALRREPRFGWAGLLSLALPGIALLVLRPLGGAADWTRYLLLSTPIALLFVARGLAGAIELLGRRLRDGRVRTWFALWLGVACAVALSPSLPPWLRDTLPGTAALALVSWSAVAIGLAGAVERFAGPGRGVAVAAALFLAGSLALSPLRLHRQHPDSFRTHPQALLPLDRDDAGRVPDFYRQLADENLAGEAILECPDPGNLIHSAPYARYQRVHGRRVLLLSPVPEGFRRGFRNLVDAGDADRIAASGARYALVHRDLNAEIRADNPPLQRFDAHAESCRNALRGGWGPPSYADDRLEVFDLRARPPTAQRRPSSSTP